MTLRRAETLAWVETETGLLVMRCDTDDVPVFLDPSAAAILAAADGAEDEAAVASRVAADMGLPSSDLADDVAQFLRVLIAEGYLVRVSSDPHETRRSDV